MEVFMKKYLWIFFIIIIIGLAFFFTFYRKNQQTKNDYRASRIAIQNNSAQNITTSLDNTMPKNNQEEIKQEEKPKEELSDFSTKLPKDTKERYSNIELACKTLNGTVVKKGETFSLWNVLGCPTKEKGYRKAKTLTSNGGVTKSYGGGICQVSTTIYNAVLEVEGLEIQERHEHSRDVVYIEDGKDAAVSYQSADLKFKNTLDYNIQIEAKVEENRVKISIVRI